MSMVGRGPDEYPVGATITFRFRKGLGQAISRGVPRLRGEMLAGRDEGDIIGRTACERHAGSVLGELHAGASLELHAGASLGEVHAGASLARDRRTSLVDASTLMIERMQRMRRMKGHERH